MFRRSQQVDVMREALLFYACADSYRRRSTHAKGSPKRFGKSPIVIDRGARASRALRQADDLQRPIRTYLLRLRGNAKSE